MPGNGKFKAAANAVIATGSKGECVQVIVRCRPMNSTEKGDGREVVVDIDERNSMITLSGSAKGDAAKNFTFDMVYGMRSEQKAIYEATVAPLVESVMEGFNGTVFAYGQTGTGKTFTMEGERDPPELVGIIPRTFSQIFETIGTIDDRHFLVRASMLEIYNEDIRDLLQKKKSDGSYSKLELKENDSGVYVKDLSSVVVKGEADLNQMFQMGVSGRTVGATKMNAGSSRSHCIFSIVVESQGEGMDGEQHVCVGKLNLVDLAGSERQAKTGATGTRLAEATKINLSLSALGNVISALVDGKSKHIPYRDSKLTRLLQDSLGGNAKTVMVANLGPADYNYDETFNTLRYANRAKNIKNKPKINEDPKDAMLREFQEEITKLQAQLTGGAPTRIEEVEVIKKIGLSEEELEEERKKLKAELAGDLEKTDRQKEVLLQQIEKKQKALREEQERKNALAEQIKRLEAKVVVGGENLLDKVEAEAAKKARLQRQLDERKQKRDMMAARLQEQQEERLEKEEHYGSLQEEVDDLTQKIKKLFNRLKAAVSENRDLRVEFDREREQLAENMEQLSRMLKFKQLLLTHYIPDEVLHRLESTAQWDPEREEWLVVRLNFAGNVMRQQDPQREDAAGGAADPKNPYAGMSMDETLAMAGGGLDSGGGPYFSYDEEARIVEDGEEKVRRKKGSSKKVKEALASTGADGGSKKKRSKSKQKRTVDHEKENAAEEFPEARGLVDSTQRFA